MLFAFRVTVLLIYFLLIACVGLLIGLVRPFNPDNSRIIAKMYAWGGQRILGVRVTAEGVDNFGQDPCIIVANHQDNLDLFILGGILPRRTVSVGKKSLIWIPFFGLMYWLAGNVLIDRGNPRKARDTMSSAVDALRERNTSIWIFPEGTRNRGENMLPFKKGAFHTAVRAGVPIVPVCVNSYVKGTDFGRRHSGDAQVRVLPAIETKGLTLDDVPRLMQQCYLQMMAGIEDLDRKLLPAA